MVRRGDTCGVVFGWCLKVLQNRALASLGTVRVVGLVLIRHDERQLGTRPCQLPMCIVDNLAPFDLLRQHDLPVSQEHRRAGGWICIYIYIYIYRPFMKTCPFPEGRLQGHTPARAVPSETLPLAIGAVWLAVAPLVDVFVAGFELVRYVQFALALPLSAGCRNEAPSFVPRFARMSGAGHVRTGGAGLLRVWRVLGGVVGTVHGRGTPTCGYPATTRPALPWPETQAKLVNSPMWRSSARGARDAFPGRKAREQRQEGVASSTAGPLCFC